MGLFAVRVVLLTQATHPRGGSCTHDCAAPTVPQTYDYEGIELYTYNVDPKSMYVPPRLWL